MYKVFVKGSKFYIKGKDQDFEYSDLAKNVLITQNSQTTDDFYFQNVNGWYPTKKVNISELFDENGNAYTKDSFISFIENKLGKGNGGTNGASIAEDMYFDTTAERDTFTTDNPDRIFEGVTCAVKNGSNFDYYQYDTSSSSWLKANLIFQGEKGEKGDAGGGLIKVGFTDNPAKTEEVEYMLFNKENFNLAIEGSGTDGIAKIAIKDAGRGFYNVVGDDTGDTFTITDDLIKKYNYFNVLTRKFFDKFTIILNIPTEESEDFILNTSDFSNSQPFLNFNGDEIELIFGMQIIFKPNSLTGQWEFYITRIPFYIYDDPRYLDGTNEIWDIESGNRTAGISRGTLNNWIPEINGKRGMVMGQLMGLKSTGTTPDQQGRTFFHNILLDDGTSYHFVRTGNGQTMRDQKLKQIFIDPKEGFKLNHDGVVSGVLNDGTNVDLIKSASGAPNLLFGDTEAFFTIETKEGKAYVSDGLEINKIAFEENTLQNIIAGSNITIDSKDPRNPIISSTGGGGGISIIDKNNPLEVKAEDGSLHDAIAINSTNDLVLGTRSDTVKSLHLATGDTSIGVYRKDAKSGEEIVDRVVMASELVKSKGMGTRTLYLRGANYTITEEDIQKNIIIQAEPFVKDADNNYSTTVIFPSLDVMKKYYYIPSLNEDEKNTLPHIMDLNIQAWIDPEEGRSDKEHRLYLKSEGNSFAWATTTSIGDVQGCFIHRPPNDTSRNDFVSFSFMKIEESGGTIGVMGDYTLQSADEDNVYSLNTSPINTLNVNDALNIKLLQNNEGHVYAGFNRETPVVSSEELDNLQLIKIIEQNDSGSLPIVSKCVVGELASGFSLCEDNTPEKTEILQIASGKYLLSVEGFIDNDKIGENVYIDSDGKLTLNKSEFVVGWVIKDGVIIDVDIYNAHINSSSIDAFDILTTRVLRVHEGTDNPEKFSETYVDGNFNTTIHNVGDTHVYTKNKDNGDLTESYQIDSSGRFIVKQKIKTPQITNPSSGTTNSNSDNAGFIDLSENNEVKLGAKNLISFNVNGSKKLNISDSDFDFNSSDLKNVKKITGLSQGDLQIRNVTGIYKKDSTNNTSITFNNDDIIHHGVHHKFFLNDNDNQTFGISVAGFNCFENKIINLGEGTEDKDAVNYSQIKPFDNITYIRKFDSNGGDIYAHSYPEGRVQSWINYKGDGVSDLRIDSMRNNSDQKYDMIAVDNQSVNICKLRLFFNGSSTLIRIMPGEIVQCWTSREFARWKWIYGTESSPTENSNFLIEENNDEIITPDKGNTFSFIDYNKVDNYGNNGFITYLAPVLNESQNQSMLDNLDISKSWFIHKEINSTQGFLMLHESYVSYIYNKDVTLINNLSMLFGTDSRGRLGKSNQNTPDGYKLNWNGDYIPNTENINSLNPAKWINEDGNITENWSSSIKSPCYSTGTLSNNGSALLQRGDVIYEDVNDKKSTRFELNNESEFFVLPIKTGGGTFSQIKVFPFFQGRKSQVIEEDAYTFNKSSDAIGTLLSIAYDSAVEQQNITDSIDKYMLNLGLSTGNLFVNELKLI